MPYALQCAAMTYLLFKSLHVITAVATISGFLLRGYWMLSESDMLQRRVVRVVPHAVDTVFLLSGVAMLWLLHLNPLTQSWLLAKFAGLVAYILLGAIAIRRGPTKPVRAAAFVAAVSMFAYIVGVALTKSPLSWIRYFAA
jgi:uncharacterized membrane protein SirB2